MKQKIAFYIIMTILSICIFMGIFCWYGNHHSNSQVLQIANAYLKDINGKTIRLVNDKPAILLFFNTRCDLCASEISLLKKHIKRLSELYNVFFISFESSQSLLDFFSAQKFNVKHKNVYIISDEKMALLDYYKIEGYPSFIIVNTNFQTVYRGAALSNKIVAELLKGNH